MRQTTARKAGLLTKLAYGFGSVADGIKNNGLEYFLLLYYSQVLGVHAALVGGALLLAMVVDGLSDPIVGYWSDNLRTTWGRRHPFMYLAAIPVAAAYYFLWQPPEHLSGNELFPYLLLMTIAVRVSFTFYEVPSSALVAEFTDDYDERTSFLSFRYVFGWFGGLSIAAYALLVLLVPTEEYGSGFLNLDGFEAYGQIASVAILISILVCALGTHSHIPNLRKPPASRKITIGKIFSEIGETLSNKSFFGLFISALFGFMAAGVAASLNYIINGFFWEFTTTQTFYLTIIVFASAFLALIIAPLISKALGKKKAAIIVGAIAFTLAPMPVVLRLLGVMPPNGSDLLFWIILITTMIDVALIITYQIISSSMIADIVEESELKTGRRSEGIFFAGISFMRKLARGSGLFLASIILSVANISRDMQPGDLSEQTLTLLGSGYAFGLLFLWAMMILFLFRYQITRADHEANLAALERTRGPANVAE
ncbi:MAG: MFS transporter [Henriciella sp.]|jgi:Na+/melibiose symporter-like transporter